MEITEEKLRSLVEEINETKKNVEDQIIAGEDLRADLGLILTRLDSMLDGLAKITQR